MKRHGSESYFILGEGLLAESLDGRPATMSTAVEEAVPPFRFSRMGPKGTDKQLGEPNREKIAEAMTVANLTPGAIPAGFTYLGQYIDHDLTFDKTILMEGADISPATLESSRSPTLDLDCLYGAGPQDPGSAQFYSDGIHLKMGAADGSPAGQGFDLPRETPGQGATIPDERNDENLAVGQIHLAMIRFHNRVVDTLPTSVPPAQRFQAARRIVTKHYQWMIRTDYLPRICRQGVVNDVFNNGRKAFEVGVDPTEVPTMPIEFSIAGFRLGHAMVRAAYNWNKIFDNGGGTLDLLFTFSATGGNLGFDTRLASIWIADWRRLYDFGEANKPALVVPASKFNRAMRIDTRMVDPLQHLPPQTVGLPNNAGFNDVRRNLAFRNSAT